MNYIIYIIFYFFSSNYKLLYRLLVYFFLELDHIYLFYYKHYILFREFRFFCEKYNNNRIQYHDHEEQIHQLIYSLLYLILFLMEFFFLKLYLFNIMLYKFIFYFFSLNYKLLCLLLECFFLVNNYIYLF